MPCPALFRFTGRESQKQQSTHLDGEVGARGHVQLGTQKPLGRGQVLVPRCSRDVHQVVAMGPLSTVSAVGGPTVLVQMNPSPITHNSNTWGSLSWDPLHRTYVLPTREMFVHNHSSSSHVVLPILMRSDGATSDKSCKTHKALDSAYAETHATLLQNHRHVHSCERQMRIP